MGSIEPFKVTSMWVGPPNAHLVDVAVDGVPVFKTESGEFERAMPFQAKPMEFQISSSDPYETVSYF